MALVSPLLVATLLLAVTAIVVAALRTGHPPPGPAVARAARRHETLVSLAAAAASVATLLALVSAPRLPDAPWAAGAATYTSPFLAGTVFCLARLLGELRWPRPVGAVRRAPLTRRTIRDVGGRRLRLLVATVALGAVAVVVLGLTAAADGRSVAHPVVHDGVGNVLRTGASGPYPGWPYGLPILVTALLALGAALAALRTVTRRPPLVDVPTEHDDAVRRTSAARVLAGAQLWVGGGLGAMLLLAAMVLGGAGWTAGAVAGAVLGLALAGGSVVAAATAVPGRTVGEQAGEQTGERAGAA